ncbi:ThiF family adenylyltransferase [Actinophytocola gossypii]|uniref:TOMM leader peptide-binding protein n=1 Tax=Actinophytocola gossypii TaxID=2812003 RepID=A0ABT2JJX7_9PSEU|nr:ThiF family adenylyltransferase [Actinophytocola gossypii]MCT2588195.1 hypothetical protein [Actinophytocola gossypii]
MESTLPRRPRAIPDLRILRRGPHEVQVGLDPRLAAVLTALTEPVVAALQRLAGNRDVDELVAEHGPTMRNALIALTTRGLVEDASRQPVPLPGRLAGDRAAAAMRAAADLDHGPDAPRTAPVRHDEPAVRRGYAVTVRGDGRLAVSVACLLAAAGVGWVHVEATGTVRPEDTGTGYRPEDVGRRRGTAARNAVARVDAGVRTTAFRADRRPDLVILTDTLVHEPAWVTALNEANVPHLNARMRDGIGIVGPFVVPGHTSCLLCADLHRCDLDEYWPRVALQLAGQVQLADLASTQATAAFAATQALDGLSWLSGSATAPRTCEATVELDLGAAAVRHRSWIPHPSCSCGSSRCCSDVAANTNEELRQSRA